MTLLFSLSFCSTFSPHPCKSVCVCMVSLEGKERKIRSEGSSPSSFFKRIQEKKKLYSLVAFPLIPTSVGTASGTRWKRSAYLANEWTVANLEAHTAALFFPYPAEKVTWRGLLSWRQVRTYRCGWRGHGSPGSPGGSGAASSSSGGRLPPGTSAVWCKAWDGTGFPRLSWAHSGQTWPSRVLYRVKRLVHVWTLPLVS